MKKGFKRVPIHELGTHDNRDLRLECDCEDCKMYRLSILDSKIDNIGKLIVKGFIASVLVGIGVFIGYFIFD